MTLNFLIDPTLYTIIQDVYRAPDPVPNHGFPQRPRPVLIFSAIYHFQYLSSLNPSATASHIQSPPVGPNIAPAMTPALGNQAHHGYPNPIRPMPFQNYSVYPPPAPEKSWTTPSTEQNVFDAPFMLDVSFDDIRFDDYIQESPDSTPRPPAASFYPTDSNAFVSSFIIHAIRGSIG
ncbi:hypothetical protein PAXRUDRAFT_487015 [Paxillus rubicundulus Ve08.2h10]|uniref:Uncharacterized protein n=1 Tax=Paxillus rubicundulus Ve08.2h10 TaxID=930991 RepID=A0A0D0E159_9AGAM|nr:hypothetical protein PAXRUDRAFT_487015 [Paxillus rubicundulus Ve08.2h10]